MRRSSVRATTLLVFASSSASLLSSACTKTQKISVNSDVRAPEVRTTPKHSPTTKARSVALLEQIQERLSGLSESESKQVQTLMRDLQATKNEDLLQKNLSTLLTVLKISDATVRLLELQWLAEMSTTKPGTALVRMPSLENEQPSPLASPSPTATPLETPTPAPNPDAQVTTAPCGSTPHGSQETRTRYLSASGATCSSEVQTRTCTNGAWGGWTGSFAFESCTATPVLTPVTFPGTFQNDSIGSQARFEWSVPGSWTTVRLAYGSNLAEIQAWDGSAGATLASGGVVTTHADCTGDELSDVGTSTGTKFNPGSSSNLLFADKCGINLSAVPAWSKRFFRLYAQSGTEETFSPVRGAGHAPPGMVLVAREDWPSDEFNANDTIPNYSGSFGRAPGVSTGPFDFAIDKYEMSGALTHCDAAGALFPCSSATKTTEAGASAKGALPNYESSWNTYKQACLNRSYEADFSPFVSVGDLAQANRYSQTVPTALRKVHMISDLEYYVASKDTPEENSAACNIQGNTLENTGHRAQCVSRYGARDLIGNLWEWTDSIFFDSNATKTEFLGTTQQATAAPVTHGVSFNVTNDLTKLYFNVFTPLLQFGASNSFSHSLQVAPETPSMGALWAWFGGCGECTGARGGGTFGHSWATVSEATGPLAASRTSYFIEGAAHQTLSSNGGKFGSRCAVVAP
jgi:hypothetical protein